jgi:hypothetical protein
LRFRLTINNLFSSKLDCLYKDEQETILSSGAENILITIFTAFVSILMLALLIKEFKAGKTTSRSAASRRDTDPLGF